MSGYVLFLLLGTLLVHVNGHGYLQKPAARNSMWRFGFDNPPNYDDNGLRCYSKGCTLCGDQNHLAGGRYANGIITGTYRAGQTIDVEINLTTSHQGYFQFYICANNDASKPINQACLDSNGPLVFENGSTQWEVGSASRLYTNRLRLPSGLTCSQCVLQWYYFAKNTREHYYNCADISITN